MQGAELARVQQVDRHSLKIIYSGGVHKTPIVIQLKENNGRFSGHVDTVRGPITLLECDYPGTYRWCGERFPRRSR